MIQPVDAGSRGRSFWLAGGLLSRCKYQVVAALACTVLTGCLFAQEPNRERKKAKFLQQSLQTGRQTFESICASCHGLDGRGGERGPDIATRAEVVRLTDAQIFKILRTGIPQSGMPAFSALGSAKLSATLNHLRSLQGKIDPQGLPGNPVTGKELFTGKAECSQCHMVKGQGGFIGPDLTNYAASQAADSVRDAIVSAEGRRSPYKSLAKVTTKDGQTVSGLVRNEDNFSVQLQSLDGVFHLLNKCDIASLAYDSRVLMPPDYAAKLTAKELDNVVAYLLSVARVGREKTKAGGKAEENISHEE